MGAWDRKASLLVKEVEDSDAKEKAEADRALGLKDGPKGPPTTKAEKQHSELNDQSKQRKEFIEWQNRMQNEIAFTHKSHETPLELSVAEVNGKSVRIKGSEGVTYVLPAAASVKKIFLERCKHVVVHVNCKVPTSTIEVYRCDEVDLNLLDPIGTIQADDCAGPVCIRYTEYDHIGGIYHQSCPGLAIAWGVRFCNVGAANPVQLSTKRGTDAEELITVAVRRGEGEYPVDLCRPTISSEEESDPAAGPDEIRRLSWARRQKGNEMFRESDFMQAAAEYSVALQLDSHDDAILANRAQCWLKLGDYEKALTDSIRCTELNPQNPKGWFRKGICLHAMTRYIEAIPALLEAEKLEPANKQVVDAIRMAQMMCKSTASGGC